MKIITIQHPEAVNRYNNKVESLIDYDLSDDGKEQANIIAENLLKELGDEEIVLYTSDLLRAKNTTAALNESLNIIKISYEKYLRANDFNKLDGKQEQILGDTKAQLLAFYKKIMERDYKTLIIVSHGDVLSLFHAMFLNDGAKGLENIIFTGVEGGVSILEKNMTGQHIIHKINDTGYLV